MAKEGGNPAIGIDLGTTYSCVAVFRNDRVEVIPNDQGSRTTPSCVAFTHNERLTGEAAFNQIARNPMNSIFDAKRLIGRKFSDVSVQSDMKLWPFEVVAGPQEKPMMKVTFRNQEKLFAPEEISSMVLSKMKETAEKFIGTSIVNTVITVPARFNDSQRSATRAAGTIAGLNVLRIINEPTAAALAYGFDRNVGTKCVLIFDAGGGTCDVSVLRIRNNNFEVKATAGDTHLGGEDLDNRLTSYFVEEIRRNHGRDIANNSRALWRLKSSCEKAKRLLSSATYAHIEIDCLDKEFDFSATITRAKFEELTIDLLEKFMKPVGSCMKDAKMSVGEVDDVVLVGGSSRIPKLQELIEEMFKGKKLCNSIHPDEAVAYGAAVQAAILTGVSSNKVGGIMLQDVTPLSLGTRIGDDVLSVIVPRNTPIPCKKEMSFITVEDNQDRMWVEIYEGERCRASDNNLLGNFTFEGIPPAPRGMGQVIDCYEVDADGILHVSVTEVTTGVNRRMTITNVEGRLSKEEIERMVMDATKYKEEDDMFRKAMKAKDSLDWCVYEAKKSVERYKGRQGFDAKKVRIVEEAISQADQCLRDSQLEEKVYIEMTRKLRLLSRNFI